MSKTYEAIYEDGHLQWLGAHPGAGRHRLRVTIDDGHPPQHSPQEVHRMLEATRGAWGRGKTLEDIDAEIDRMRFHPPCSTRSSPGSQRARSSQ